MKKILLTLVLLLTVFALTSCDLLKKSKNNGSDADLKITFFNGGYGEEWINNLAKRFEEAKGVKVEAVSSNEGNCGAENYIKSGYNLSDIYFGENIPWKSLVQSGYLEDLTDVYEATVETRNGTQKIKDFMDSSAASYFYAQRQLKTAEYTPWAMPWTVQPNAMAYNEDILLQVKHISQTTVSEGLVDKTTNKWVNPPKTLQDLYAFCEDVIAFNDNSAEKQALNDTHTYAPIGWAGSNNIDSIGFMIITWWVEAQGLSVSNYTGEGSFYDFFNYGNTSTSNVNQTLDLNVWNQSGLALAYDTFADLFFDADGKFQNTLSDPLNNNSQQLQQLFVANKVKEKPVISIASSYLENEVIKNRYIDSDQDGKQDVTFKFMNVPTLNEGSENYLYSRLSDCAVIPHKAAHIDLAKEFLIFMCSEEEIDNFTVETNGGIRPFNCDVRTEVTGNEYSAFANSLFEVYYNSVRFCEYPGNTKTLGEVAHLYRYENPGYIGNVSWTEIINVMKAPGAGQTPGKAISTAVISRLTQTNVDAWVLKYKLTNITK